MGKLLGKVHFLQNKIIGHYCQTVMTFSVPVTNRHPFILFPPKLLIVTVGILGSVKLRHFCPPSHIKYQENIFPQTTSLAWKHYCN